MHYKTLSTKNKTIPLQIKDKRHTDRPTQKQYNYKEIGQTCREKNEQTDRQTVK